MHAHAVGTRLSFPPSQLMKKSLRKRLFKHLMYIIYLYVRIILYNSFRVLSNGTLHHTDTDECQMEMDDCDMNAVCTNTPGSFTCTCKDGYEGDGTTCNSENSKL